MNTHQEQFQAIQSMLAAGHRSVHLERHSLLLIGGVGGFLSVVTEWVITDTCFPDLGQRGAALLAWLAFWLGGMALVEHYLTRRARARRAETLPFAQAQVTRAWWMLLGVGCLASFAMLFHGGGGMIYALWTVMLGLGIYFYGLFSRPLIEWIGLAVILLGIAGLAAGLPYGATRWLNASCFAIGMPLAGWLNARVGNAGLANRVAVLALWLAVVATPPLLAVRYATTPAPTAAAVAAGAVVGTGEQVLRLETGSRVPLRVDLDGPILAVAADAGLDLTLNQPIEIALRDGQPDGRYRIGTGAWHTIHEGILQLRIDRIRPRLADGGPEVRAHASFGGAEFEGETR
ncbi:MAG: hypothetical protein HGA75_03720 [Thiobacillus sp.]|nr:hypothetical protein [Thiobacillus sp.]